MSNEETKDVDMADAPAAAPAAEGEVSNLHMFGWVVAVSISVHYPQPSVSSDPVPHPAAAAFTPAEAAPELHRHSISWMHSTPTIFYLILLFI